MSEDESWAKQQHHAARRTGSKPALAAKLSPPPCATKISSRRQAARAHLWKPHGLSTNPAASALMIGKSSSRGRCVTPKLCHRTGSGAVPGASGAAASAVQSLRPRQSVV